MTELPQAPPRSWATAGLLLVAVMAVLHYAREFALPVAVALVLSLVFMPVVRRLKRLHLPAPLGAAIVVLGLLAAFSTAIVTLAEPAGAWIAKAPEGLRALEPRLRLLTGHVKEVTRATDQVQDLTQDLSTAGASPAQEVTVKTSLLDRGLTATRDFGLGAISTLVLLYFLLASDDLFLRKTIEATPRVADQARALAIAREVEAGVSAYLLTVTLINIGLGAAVAVTMLLLGVPNPALWGAMVAILNFVPYLGEITGLAALTIVGLLTFDDLWVALRVPGAFVLLSIGERYLVTPLVIGRRLRLNPVVIVLSVLFWGAMWGVGGALLAVPILVALKTFCDRVERLQKLGTFLGA